MGIKLYPILKKPAADILGQFQAISSVKWLICFKSSKSDILIDRSTIEENLLDSEPRKLTLSHVSACSKCLKPGS